MPKQAGYRVGAVGTFDVDNYGDLLFPLIAARELGERLPGLDLVTFAYGAKSAADWPFPVVSVGELPRRAAGLDALLLGGGYLVRFDKGVAAGYAPASPAVHHPTGFWLTPALIGLQHGVPLLWNAPGANHADLPPWAEPLLDLVLSQSAYVAVRDEPARTALARFCGANPVELVPDTVFGLGRWLPLAPSFELNRLRDAVGLAGPYILVQAVRGLDGCFAFLKRHADRLCGYRLLALPIGPVNGDDVALVDDGLPGLVRLAAPPPPLLLAELIRHAAAVIGPSYHLAITALGAGVPVFSPADFAAGKFPGLAGYEGLYPLPAESTHDADWFLSRVGQTAVTPKAAAATARVAAHWDAVAQVIVRGRTDSAVAVGRFWQSLPGLLEGHAARAAAALGAIDHQEAAAAERDRGLTRIAELRRLIALARSEIATRDYQIAQLLASTSWKVSAPLRFVGRLLGR